MGFVDMSRCASWGSGLQVVALAVPSAYNGAVLDWGNRDMKRLQLGLAVLVACVVLSSARAAHAQRGYTPYRRPTLSPWLNLYRRDSGPLDSYHMFVRPEIRLRETLQRQQANIRRQGAGLNSLGQQMTRYEREGPVRPTGTGSTFMNYSHFFPVRGAAASRSFRPPPPRRSYRSFRPY